MSFAQTVILDGAVLSVFGPPAWGLCTGQWLYKLLEFIDRRKGARGRRSIE